MLKDQLLRIFVAQFLSHTQQSVAVGFVVIQPSFLQLLTQTWVMCTSLDSSRCVVYSGIRFKAIRAISKRLEQDE